MWVDCQVWFQWKDWLYVTNVKTDTKTFKVTSSNMKVIIWRMHYLVFYDMILWKYDVGSQNKMMNISIIFLLKLNFFQRWVYIIVNMPYYTFVSLFEGGPSKNKILWKLFANVWVKIIFLHTTLKKSASFK